jgi:ABC-2 type transport system ATP-binding protein
LLTVTEHLHFIALAYRVENAETKYAGLLDELELADKKDEPASSLSRGMLQKLSLACAFLREPRVIILDEPLTGLDPRGIRNIKESIRFRAAAGMAFLLSSHLLELVEALCDQVMIFIVAKRWRSVRSKQFAIWRPSMPMRRWKTCSSL